jgi:hypothetical protein
MKAGRLLDPRFHYVNADATDVAATWRRFGFNPRANEERRARLRRLVSDVTAQLDSETPAIRALVRLKA